MRMSKHLSLCFGNRYYTDLMQKMRDEDLLGCDLGNTYHFICLREFLVVKSKTYRKSVLREEQ